MDNTSRAAITTGNTGQQWRASITEYGAVLPWDDDTPPLNWYVAADDRWHVPAEESSVRQTRIGGAAVTETRVRVPNGDVVQRIYSTANDGGLTVVEVENESTLAVAIGFDRRGLLTERPISDTPVEGIDLPAEAFVLPLGHAASLRIGIPHGAPTDGPLPAVPPAEQVVRGWWSITERAGRSSLPDGEIGASLAEWVTAQRCELALGSIPTGDDDPIGFALGLDQLVRMGEQPEPWIDELAAAVEAIGPVDGWSGDAALRAAQRVLLAADEGRAARDVVSILDRRSPQARPTQCPSGLAALAWHDERFASGSELLPAGIPEAWLGQSFEVYGVPTVGASSVSFGVRWHGENPAVLWEQGGEPVDLTAPQVAPEWATSEANGETLWTGFTPG